MFEDAKVNIRGDIVKLFREKFGNGAEAPSLNKTVNVIMEKNLTGRLVERADHNLIKIKQMAQHFNCTNDDALNIALNSVEFELRETPKTRITLDTGEKVKVKRGKFAGNNPVTSY